MTILYLKDFPRFTFPDGQPHLEVPEGLDGDVDLFACIRSPADLFDLGMACDALVRDGNAIKSLNISYLMGGRMDRPIGRGRPCTLDVVTEVLQAFADENDVETIRFLDPHSSHTVRGLLSVNARLETVYPVKLLQYAVRVFLPDAIVVPDAGAEFRTRKLMQMARINRPIVQCAKKRNSDTGALSGFELVTKWADAVTMDKASVLIVDDLADGGGTFTGLAGVLRAAGAAQVGLCVTHAVLSKGLPIPGIDYVFTTDSYGSPAAPAASFSPGAHWDVMKNYMEAEVFG